MTRQVMVDREVLRQVIRALMGYGSTLHVQAHNAKPGVKEAKLSEVEQVQRLELALRAALAQPPAEPERALDKLGQIAFEAFQVSYDLPLLRKYENMMPGERRAWRAVAAALIQPPAGGEQEQAHKVP